MKRLKYLALSLLTAAVALGAMLAAQAYTVQVGDTVSALAVRFGTTVSAITNVNHLQNKNLILVGQQLSIPGRVGSQSVGANPLPEDKYDTYITAPVGVLDTVIYVNTLPTSATTSIFTIFASDGRTVSEKVYCVGTTTTPSYGLTNCVRGLSTTAVNGVISEAAGTGVVHSKNSRIAITDNINFTGKALAILNGSQITGANTLRLGDGFSTTSDKCYIFDNGNQNTKICKQANTSTLYWTTDGVNTYAFASSTISQLSASSTQGIQINNSQIGVNPSSTLGMTFGLDGKLYQKTSSTAGLAADVNGIYVKTSTSTILFDNSGNLKVNASSTAASNTIPIASTTNKLYGWTSFGGTGSDGDFTATTTVFDIGNAKVFEKNFLNLTITGTSSISFINPSSTGSIVIIRVLRNATITSASTSIYLVGIGASGGASVSGISQGGNAGTTSTSGLLSSQAGGGGLATSASSIPGAMTTQIITNAFHNIFSKHPWAFIGAGGGGGGTGGNTGGTSGVGGRGGGSLLMEVAGYLNCSSTINISGANGTNGSGERGGGGGGGSAGFADISYNTASSTAACIVTANGGTGGSTTGGGNGSGGAGGGNPKAAGIAGDMTSGGAGAAGESLISQNKDY